MLLFFLRCLRSLSWFLSSSLILPFVVLIECFTYWIGKNVHSGFSIRCYSQAPGGKTHKSVGPPWDQHLCNFYLPHCASLSLFWLPHWTSCCTSVTVQIGLFWLLFPQRLQLVSLCSVTGLFSVSACSFCSSGGSSSQCDLTSLVEVDFYVCSALYLVLGLSDHFQAPYM